MTYTHELNETTRIKLEYYSHGVDLEYMIGDLSGMSAGVLVTKMGWDHGIVTEIGGLYLANAMHSAEIDSDVSLTADDLERAVTDMLESDYPGLGVGQWETVRGYSQGDAWRVFVFAPTQAILDDILHEVSVWLRGDVYDATVEELVTWANPEHGTRQTWEAVPDYSCVTVWASKTDIYVPSLHTCLEALDYAFEPEPSN